MTFGIGLLKGMKVTMKAFLSKPITTQYPHEKREVSERYRGILMLEIKECIACGMCSATCPADIIDIRTSYDENGNRKLDSYHLAQDVCLFCGLCAEACPTGAITMTNDYEVAVLSRDSISIKYKY